MYILPSYPILDDMISFIYIEYICFGRVALHGVVQALVERLNMRFDKRQFIVFIYKLSAFAFHCAFEKLIKTRGL
jgi:hypothetical protein